MAAEFDLITLKEMIMKNRKNNFTEKLIGGFMEFGCIISSNL